MKISENKPQLNNEIKSLEIDLDLVMKRLALLANSERPTEIMRWMGVGSSTYTNWKRNGSVPYRTIVCVLLEKGISLDAFFAPEERLAVPDELILAEQSRTYNEADWQGTVIRATLDAKKLLARAKLPEKEIYIKFLVDIWMVNEGKMFDERRFEDVLVNHLKTLESQKLCD
ncbi:MAG TPA: hypothetical protein VKY35_04710 [Aliidiomarina sp.]|nr:hypothetical protein [Aliidiomarina sp.]